MHNAFTEEINKIALIFNDDQRISKTIDSIETNAYSKNKNLVYRKEEIKCNATIE